MAIVFSQMFRFSMEGTNYIVYLMTGIVVFQFFSDATNQAMSSIVSNFCLIRKKVLPLSPRSPQKNAAIFLAPRRKVRYQKRFFDLLV